MATEFASAGETPGVTAWRIEQMKPVRCEANGKFHTARLRRQADNELPRTTMPRARVGDAYLLLHTATSGAAFTNSIHFWIGKESSQDESSAAAMLAVELDNSLSGRGLEAGISRHTEGNESDTFVALFPNGVSYAPGGVASGLKAPAPSSDPQLYRLTGRRQFRLTKVAASGDSLNSGDGFVLSVPGGEEGSEIYQWLGVDAGPALKYRLLTHAMDLNSSAHGGDAQMVVLKQGETGDDAAAFYAALGVKDPAAFKPAPPQPAAAAAAGPAELAAVQYIVEGDDTPLGFPLQKKGGSPREHAADVRDKAVTSRQIKPVSEEPSAYMLTADAMLLLYNGATLFVWLGKRTPAALRTDALALADKFKFQNDLPKEAPVEIVKQGLEGPVFKSALPDWRNVQAAALAAAKTLRAAEAAEEADATAAAHAVDVLAMAAHQPEEAPPVDDGSGTKQVWRIESFEPKEQPTDAHGTFTAGDCYVVLYSYGEGGAQRIVYTWQGAEASQDERGACAMAAVKVDEVHAGGAAPQVRVTQGKEPPHFVQLWGGKMIVYSGGVASGFRTLQDDDAAPDDAAPRLFQVKASGSVPPYAVQVPAEAASLNSGDAFVSITPTHAYVWAGGACLPAEKAAAESMAQAHFVGAAGREVVACAEGSEAEGFWDALGGKGEYSNVPAVEPEHPPRLFVFNDAATRGHGVSSDEVLHFSQADLLSEDVALLDTGAALFVWLGSGASDNEKSEAPKVAAKYLEASGRSADTPVTTVKEGAEPPMFTAHFHGWSADARPPTAADYDAKVEALRAANAPKKQPANGHKAAPGDDLDDIPTAASAAKAPKTPPLDLPTATNGAANGAAAENGAKREVQESAVEEVTEDLDTSDEQPSETAAAETPEPPHPAEVAEEKTPSVADTVRASQSKTDAAASTALPPVPSIAVKDTSTIKGGTVPGKSLTAQTTRGGADFAPATKDPSGSKGEELKHPPGSTTFELAKLKGMNGADGIDPTVKEKYLAPDNFMEAFGMDAEKFAAQPLWRRQQHKKKVGLF